MKAFSLIIKLSVWAYWVQEQCALQHARVESLLTDREKSRLDAKHLVGVMKTAAQDGKQEALSDAMDTLDKCLGVAPAGLPTATGGRTDHFDQSFIDNSSLPAVGDEEGDLAMEAAKKAAAPGAPEGAPDSKRANTGATPHS